MGYMYVAYVANDIVSVQRSVGIVAIGLCVLF